MSPKSSNQKPNRGSPTDSSEPPALKKGRNIPEQAVRGTQHVSKEAGHLARGAVSGAIQAVNEVGGEASSFVKDAVMVVLEGTGVRAKTTTPVVRDAVEGAIHGAVSIGMNTEDAAKQASQGVVNTMQGAEGDFGDAAKATVSGVISGVAAAGGDVQNAAVETARELVSGAAEAGEDLAAIAQSVVEGAVEATKENGLAAVETVQAVANETIEAAYEISEEIGDTVRAQVHNTIAMPLASLAPAIQVRYDEAAQRLSEEMERRPGGWRFRTLWSAGRSLISIGGIDLAASLAYFTLLSFFPLIALVVLVFASFGDSEGVRQRLSEVLLFYFPASQEFLNAAIAHVFDARLQVGIIAVIAMFLGGNGLFMAANRAVNRIFGIRPKKLVGSAVMQFALVAAVVLIFLAALSLTVVFQVVISFSEAFLRIGPITTILIFVAGVMSAILPFLLTALVFAVVYNALPNMSVSWRDSTFGGIIAVILFELAKHLFFWFIALTSQRSLLYGTLSSVIILLIWSNVAGMIFLYGVALTKESARLRPKGLET